MSETVNFPGEFRNGDEITHYYSEKISQIEAGETVWMQRTFDTDSGRTLDLWSDGKHMGYIEQEYDDRACEVYKTSDDSEQGPIALHAGRVSFMEAVELLQQSL